MTSTEQRTDTLAEFLLARITEDEQLASKAVAEAPKLTWQAEKVYAGVYSIDLGPATHPDRNSFDVGEDVRMPREMAKHIEAFRPARALAECAAKRKAVDCLDLIERRPENYQSSLAHSALCALAQPYSDHPDYRAEWRP